MGDYTVAAHDHAATHYYVMRFPGYPPGGDNLPRPAGYGGLIS
ncbi:hypothetical protein ABH920_001863 [Catenulispora sp. EB89]